MFRYDLVSKQNSPILFCPYWDNKMKHIREHATLYSHLNYNGTNDDSVEGESENGDDAFESKIKSIDDALESASYNGPYESKI